MDFLNIPKIELHCHLDGSMNLEITKKLYEEKFRSIDVDELRRRLQVADDCRNLAEYLEKFDLPITLIQTPEGLMESAYGVAKDAALENVKYIEVRFAPEFSKAEGMRIPDILESVNKGLIKAKEEFGIESGIIVCAMRHMDMETNLNMLHESMELFKAGVVACDIAGDEAPHTNLEYARFFEYARKMGIPFTIHSGECGNANNIVEAIELGAGRVGHGIAMTGHPDIIKLCADKRIGVELCPKSNLQTKAVLDFNRYPFEEFYKAGVPVSINTDNRTVSNSTCSKEWGMLSSIYDFSEEDVMRIYRDSVEVSFASDDIKHNLLR